MDSYFQRIADEWRDRAAELAMWTMAHLVNRTDVWGRYLPLKHRQSAQGITNNAITAPFRNERGKVFLGLSSLEKHYKTRTPGGVLGVHSCASDGASRWMAIDIDWHDLPNLSVTPEANFVAAQFWWNRLRTMGFDPLLIDSNGRGGYHIVVLFAAPVRAASAQQFLKGLVTDYERHGLDALPDLFPGRFEGGHYGSWLRLPGRHHTHDHYTRIWNDEPWSDDKWLSGHDAIDRLLRTQCAPGELLDQVGITKALRTICLDFDGVIHSYRSGWCGETEIPDPPIHGTREAIIRLRRTHRVVICSARCRSAAGRQGIHDWLARHQIEVDEICEHKPPAHIYIDDRALRFTGDWEQTLIDIHEFRR